MSITDRFTKWLAKFFGPQSLKASAAAALASIADTKAEIKAEEERLAKLKADAVTSASETLQTLASQAKDAATAEVEAEKARAEKLTTFDGTTADQVAAIERKLRALKARRSSDRSNVAELNDERTEAAAEFTAASEAEAALLAEIEALIEDADAQAGLNGAK
jgi:chromosome segregation ATPase